jgi:hypothetical protein
MNTTMTTILDWLSLLVLAVCFLTSFAFLAIAIFHAIVEHNNSNEQ